MLSTIVVFDVVVRVSLLCKMHQMYSVAGYELGVERNFNTLEVHDFDMFSVQFSCIYTTNRATESRHCRSNILPTACTLYNSIQDEPSSPATSRIARSTQMKRNKTCQTYRRTLPEWPAEARHQTRLRSSPRKPEGLRTSASLLGSRHRLISQVGVCGSCREHSYGRLL